MKALQCIFLCSALLGGVATAYGQRPHIADSVQSHTGDSTHRKPMPAQSIKPYGEVITADAKTSRGLLTVHQVGDKYYLEIPDSLLGHEMLLVTRLSKSAANMRSMMEGYEGDEVNEGVVRFEKGPAHKMFLRGISYSEYAKDSSSDMYHAVINSNMQPILGSFDIAAFSPDKKGSVIDVTAFLNADNDVLFMRSVIKLTYQLTSQQADKSYIESIHTYPANTEIRVVKTYARNNGGVATLELNTSLVMLPSQLMRSRYFDQRVGYFTVGYKDFDHNPQGVDAIEMIKRWRLEPRPEDMEKYRRGELVEPQHPIVFYIDPATPKKWVPYLMQGVNDWQIAFEKAGFKNAIMAREAPSKQEDSTWSLEDARYSAIVYKPSAVANAMGPSIADPRTGEILESHVSWYHNVMQLLRNWYMLQAGNIDPRARHMVFSDELMGQLIRFVSSHEIGHTLGLRHNFGSSSTVPVEKLRDKQWVEAHGHTPSIMDYARFNYVAQPEDSIGPKGIYPRIGDYDVWAIEWGYRLLPQYQSADEEQGYLNKWVIEKNKDPRLWFGTETNPDDPRSQNEDLGDNAMKAGEYGIKNLQRILPQLAVWTREDNKDYDGLKEMYGELVNQYMRYMGHVMKNIGGIYETPKTVEQEGPVYRLVPQKTQQEALAFLGRNILSTPTWLFNTGIADKTGVNQPSLISTQQQRLLSDLLGVRRLQKLLDAEAQHGRNVYTLTMFLDELQTSLFTEAKTGGLADINRRNLQTTYITQLGGLLKPAPAASSMGRGAPGMEVPQASSEIKAAVRAQLKQLRVELNTAVITAKDKAMKMHWQEDTAEIDIALKPTE